MKQARLTEPITFVTASNDRGILASNFLASPCLASGCPHQVLIQEGFPSASLAYNDAIDRSENDLIVFAHQDILFATNWIDDLRLALAQLDESDPSWGVLGCYGETLHDNGRGYILSGAQGILGKPFRQPEPVQTLDEIVLILRKSSGMRFDESLPHFHFYGADMSLQAAQQKRGVYVIPAFCVHNTSQQLALPVEFYECYSHFRLKWQDWLPIQTTVIRITRSQTPMYMRRIKEAYLKYVRRRTLGAQRVVSGMTLLQDFEQTLNRKSCLERAELQ
jgi:hypothetical protein